MKPEVNPFVVYTTYMAMKLHFEKGSYDAFKFNFKGPRMKMASFLKSKDRFVYERLAKKHTDFIKLVEFFLANILEGNNWIRDMTDEVHMVWTAKIQRLTYQFNIDMDNLKDHAANHNLTFDDCLKATSSGLIILDLHRRELITLESLVILDLLCDFVANTTKASFSDPLGIISDKLHTIKQYKPFIESRINKSATKNTVINLFTEMKK